MNIYLSVQKLNSVLHIQEINDAMAAGGSYSGSQFHVPSRNECISIPEIRFNDYGSVP